MKTFFFESIYNTQEYALSELSDEPILVISYSQEKGKGTSNRTWLNADQALACSLAVKQEDIKLKHTLIPLLSSYIFTEVLNDINLSLKWPNDIVLNNLKVGGGKGSAQSLRQEGMIVKVTEIDPICAMQACMDGFEVVSPYIGGLNNGEISCINTDLMSSIDLLVTTTGNINVCDANMLQTIKSGSVVCNIGHFDNEIDTKYMRDNWKWEEVKPQVHRVYRNSDDYLILLSEGRLVNLGNATGHPSRIMDGSFANQVLAQIYLYEKKFADLPANEKKENLYLKVLPKKLDEEVGDCLSFPGSGL